MSNFEEHIEMRTPEELEEYYDYQGEQQEDRRMIEAAEKAKECLTQKSTKTGSGTDTNKA